MKLSKETLTLLKNFSSINSNLTIKPGSKITTISAGKNIIADAVVAETFPVSFGIYDLNEFLGTMSLFNDPELEFQESFVLIKEGHNTVKYFSASPSVLQSVPNIKAFPEADIEFELSSSNLTQVQRVASILKVPDFSVVGDGSTIRIQVGDKSNPSGNTYNSDLAPTDKTFVANFKVDNLKMLGYDYHVAIGGKKIGRFEAKMADLVYYCALELDSTFDF